MRFDDSLLRDGSLSSRCYVESFNVKLRYECLNRERLNTLLEAQVLVAAWRREFNPISPHGSLGYHPPAPETQQPPDCFLTLVTAIGRT